MTPTVPVRRRERPADPRRSSGRPDWAWWPTYDAAATGLREYWYPVAWSSQVGRKPMAVEVGDGADRAAARRRRHGLRAARSLPAPRRAPVAGPAGVPRHDHLPVPRLDVPAVRRRARRHHHRRAGLADVRQGGRHDVSGRRGARAGLGVPRRRRAAPADRAAPRGARRRAADGRRRPDRGPRRQLAVLRRERLRRGPRQVPPPHVVLADVQDDADVEQGAHRAPRALDLPHRGRAPLGSDVPGTRHVDQRQVVEAQAEDHAGQVARQHGRGAGARPLHRRPGLPGVRLAGHAGDAAHRLPALHPLRVLRADRRRAHEVRRRDGQVRLGPRPGVVLRPLPRRDPLAVPRQLLRPGPLDGGRDQRPAGAPLPPRRVAARVAPAGRGGPPVAPANRTKGIER